MGSKGGHGASPQPLCLDPAMVPLKEAIALSPSEPKCSGHWEGHTPLTTVLSSLLPGHLETNIRPLSHPYCQKESQAHVPSPRLPGRANRIPVLGCTSSHAAFLPQTSININLCVSNIHFPLTVLYALPGVR